MAWTSPRTWNVGELVTKLIMDTHIRDNLNYLKEQLDLRLNIVGRQGGSATNWNTQGTTNYVPASAKVLAGTGRITFSGTSSSSVEITYPTAFTYNPVILLTSKANAVAPASTSRFATGNETNTRFFAFAELTGIATGTLDFFWMAIGE